MKALIAVLGLIWLTGCAAFEQTPEDMQKKIGDPTKGQLYVPEPEKGR